MEKQKQLGMNPSTAAHRLRIDLLFSFATKLGYKCYHCSGVLVREGFSIEHKSPWLHADDPKETFFDLENIAFSHLSCNSSNKRHPTKKYFSDEERKAGAAIKMKEWKQRNYNPTKRSEKYARTGT